MSGDGSTAEIGTAKIAIRAPSAARRPSALLLGIRPEHIAWRPQQDGTGGGLNGTVDLIETIEPESDVTIVLQDPAAKVRHADDYMAGAATERG